MIGGAVLGVRAAAGIQAAGGSSGGARVSEASVATGAAKCAVPPLSTTQEAVGEAWSGAIGQ